MPHPDPRAHLDSLAAPQTHHDWSSCDKRVEQVHARSREVGGVPGHDSQSVDQCDCGNLLVQFVLGMRCAQSAPNLSGIAIEGKDEVRGMLRAAHHRVLAGTGANQFAPPLTSSTCPFSVQ